MYFGLHFAPLTEELVRTDRGEKGKRRLSFLFSPLIKQQIFRGLFFYIYLFTCWTFRRILFSYMGGNAIRVGWTEFIII